MLIVAVLAGALVLAGIAGLINWIRLARTCRRKLELPAEPPVDKFNGDVMCRYVMTSGSLARLEFFDWGVRLRGIAVSRWIVPTWEARYDELAIAELVTLPWSRIAVWLRLRGRPDRIGFLSMYSRDILALLERHEVQVDRSVSQVQKIAELYGPQ